MKNKNAKTLSLLAQIILYMMGGLSAGLFSLNVYDANMSGFEYSVLYFIISVGMIWFARSLAATAAQKKTNELLTKILENGSCHDARAEKVRPSSRLVSTTTKPRASKAERLQGWTICGISGWEATNSQN